MLRHASDRLEVQRLLEEMNLDSALSRRGGGGGLVIDGTTHKLLKQRWPLARIAATILPGYRPEPAAAAAATATTATATAPAAAAAAVAAPAVGGRKEKKGQGARRRGRGMVGGVAVMEEDEAALIARLQQLQEASSSAAGPAR